MKMKLIIGDLIVFCLCAVFMSSCSDNDSGSAINSPVAFVFKMSSSGNIARMSSSDNVASNIPDSLTLYSFVSGSFDKSFILKPKEGKAFAPNGWMAGKSYFLSGASISITKGENQDAFANSIVSVANGKSPSDFVVGSVDLPEDIDYREGVSVPLSHGTARIDLNTKYDTTTVITSMTINGASKSSYIFPTETGSSARPELTDTTTYNVEFGNGGLKSGVNTGAAYAYDTPSQVHVTLNGTQKGSPISLSIDLPYLHRGKAYEISVLGSGAEITAVFSVKDWEEGLTVETTRESDGRILFSSDYSELPDGVTADYSSNTVKVSNKGADNIKLAFVADFDVDISEKKGVTSQNKVEVSDAVHTTTSDNRHLSTITVSIPAQGKGSLGYSIVLDLKATYLDRDSYDFVEIEVAPSDKVVETVDMAGHTWMAFNASGQDASDQIYLTDDIQTVEEMYQKSWRNTVGCFFLHGSPYKYGVYTNYNPIPASGAIDDGTSGWLTDSPTTYEPCPADFRVPTREELNDLLPNGITIPSTYRAGNGDSIVAEIKVADVTTADNKVARYLKLTSKSTGNTMFIPFVGYKGDKEHVANPRNSGTAIYLWAGDGRQGGYGWKKAVVLNTSTNTASVSLVRQPRQSFASARCLKR